MKTALAYCHPLVAPVGSNLYYSLLFTPTEKKEAIVALHAFYHELESIEEKCKTPEMAMQRFQWWRGELHRLFNGTPEHIAGKALYPFIQKYHLPKTIFSALIEGMETKYLHPYYETIDDLVNDAHHSWSLIAILSAHVLGDTSKEAFLLARDLGVCWLLSQCIKKLPWHLHQKRYAIPTELLTKHQLTQTTFTVLFTKKNPKKKILKQAGQTLKELAEIAKKYYQSAIESAPTTTQKTQTSSLIYTQLALAPLKKLNKTTFSPKNYPLLISPIRKWWISTKIHLTQ